MALEKGTSSKPKAKKPSVKKAKKTVAAVAALGGKPKPPMPRVTKNEGASSSIGGSKAKKVIRKATRRAVRKGVSGPTEDSLGITKNEGSARLQNAIRKVGYEKAVGVAAKTRMKRGQTYEGGKGWVSKKPSRRKVKAKKS